jgi:hypothetical protein
VPTAVAVFLHMFIPEEEPELRAHNITAFFAASQ